MDSDWDGDAQEARLRSHFGFMLTWTAAAIGILGFFLGELLLALTTGSGFFLGIPISQSGQVAAQLSGHIIVGTGVIAWVIKRYLEAPVAGGLSSGA